MQSFSQHSDLKHNTKQADFAQNLMSSICGDHRLETTYRNTLDFQYDGLRLPNKHMTIGCIQYGANVAINISQLKAYSISLPLNGKQSLNIRGEHYQSDQSNGLIVSNNDFQDLFIDKDCKKLQVVIPEQSMQLVLSDLLNHPVHESIIFNPNMDLALDQMIGAWWSNIQNFMLVKSQYTDFYGLRMFSEDYENFLIKALLLSQENNFSEALRNLSSQEVPLFIRNVKKFMIDHAHEMLSIEMILRVAGVSKSKLYDQFQYYYGMSPLVFLKKHRLQKVYKILSSGQQQDISISKVAYDWGFSHLSRFSQEYREEFGENPSETKAKFQ
ncbi:AraC family transcriptional regulator [Acinetobacter celticus]|uniref:AraC family transcriptional regulator n=1 Tax=Acinetobacter celticus TaxID=1891224 RepID=A0A1C3CVT0_9GAMM|nr:AraC family transcriptional regulator [Acinetobacter celticus]ODA12864.1 AraC family transcriptional regulator [Acinetobacter celticus]